VLLLIVSFYTSTSKKVVLADNFDPNQWNCSFTRSIETCKYCLYNHIQGYTGQTPNNGDFSQVQGCISTSPPTTLNAEGDAYYTGYYYYSPSLHLIEPFTLVEIDFSLSSMDGIDDLAGTVSTSGLLRVLWNDYRLSWNETLAPCFTENEIVDGINFVSLPPSWVWTPGLSIDNGIFSNVGPHSIWLYHDGLIKSDGQVSITSSCSLDLSLYPFDTQHCFFNTKPASSLAASGIKFVQKDKPKVAEGFTSSSAWNTLSIQSEGVLKMHNGYFQESVYSFSVTAKRYTSFYYTTSVVPMLLLAVVATTAIFIKEDLATRVAVEITVLLTTMAILWSTSTNLPHSSSSTWLEDFTVASTTTCGLCTFESCLVLVLSAPVEGEHKRETLALLMTAFSISKTKGTGTSDIGSSTSLQSEPSKDMFGSFYN